MVPAAPRVPGLVLCLLGAGPIVPPQTPDPFAPGTRWRFAPADGERWIPRSVAFAAGGELVWTGLWGADPGLALVSSAEGGGAGSPLFEDAVGGALGPIQVAAGAGPGELFALAQFPSPLASSRATLVTRHDACAAARGRGFEPLWTSDLGFLTNGAARLAASGDGRHLAVAVFDSSASLVRVERLDPASGGSLAHTELAGDSARALVLSDDGQRLALGAGARVFVLDGSGTVLFERVLPGANPALALSGDGRWLAHGEGASVRLWEEGDGGFGARLARDGAPGELPVSLALSRDGATLAIAWWDVVDETHARLEVLDLPGAVPVNAYEQSGAATGLQNLPSALAITPDGRRIALGLWGAQDERPECLLFARGEAAPLLALDLPGSVEALALEQSGTRLVAACKDSHANRFASTGALVLLDTGERDLQLLSSARPGATVELALCSGAPLRAAFFAAGFLRPASTSALGGELWLDLSRPHVVWPGALDGAERARAALALPPGTDLVGVPLGIQAAGLADTFRLARTLVRLPIL